MRRIGQVWGKVIAFDNLMTATARAARGKKDVRGVARFLDRRESEVLKLQRELQSGSYRPGQMTTFWIHDPKKREITTSPFRDRVVHHALIDPLEPYFDQRMIDQSYACRRGKGQHAALRYAQRQLRRYDYFLKLDIQRFFPSLSHSVVMDTLTRIIKDRRVLELCRVILSAGTLNTESARRAEAVPIPAASPTGDLPGRSIPGRGLPIGHLTSQWFANLVLDRLDHHVKEELRVPGYSRYMDDFVLFDDSKSRLRKALDAVHDYLSNLDLTLKQRATILAPSRQGLPFLGFQLYPQLLRLRPENKRRSWRRLLWRCRQHACGLLDENEFADCVRSTVAHLQVGDTLELRRDWFSSNRFLREQVDFSSDRVNRGGSFNNAARNARSANRNNNAPTIQNNNLGLRFAKVSPA